MGDSRPAWNGWYHVNGNTYGTWLPGDPRGWRTRWHRQHVEGDYKNPPPKGMHESLHKKMQESMTRPAVYLEPAQSAIAGKAMVEKFVEVGIELLAISVDRIHYHILARFPDRQVRRPVGRAKKHASHELTPAGIPGTVWAKKCRALPVRDRRHQVNVFRYILNHAEQGAWTWHYKEGLYWRERERERERDHMDDDNRATR